MPGYLTAIDAKTGETIATFGTTAASTCASASTATHDDSPAANQQSRPNLRGPHHHVVARGRRTLRVLAGRHPRLQRAHGRAQVGVPHRAAARRVRRRHWPEKGLGKYGGVHNWSESTVDVELGIVYIPTGTARYDFYGGNRHGDNLFGNSLVALDARSGKRSGTSRRSTTICGTTTCRLRRSC